MMDRDQFRKLITETARQADTSLVPAPSLPSNLGKMTPAELQRWISSNPCEKAPQNLG